MTPPARAGLDRSQGPFDEAEDADDRQRVDLGALRVPARSGTELRLELEEGTKRVIAATVVVQGSTLQLQAFAAPRTEGIWAEIRAELASTVERQGGSAEEATGPFGPELLARVPARTADGRTGHTAARFIGVDGPRWFLRGVVSGPAAVDPAAAAVVEDLLRGTVVVRGTEAMAPRDGLTLTMPATARPAGDPAEAGDGGTDADGTDDGGAQGAGENGAGEDGAGGEPRPRLAPPRRGPEITERR